MMRKHHGLNLLLALLLAACVGACVTGGEVVKVTSAKKDPYAGLKQEDLAKLDEIKKAQEENPEVDPRIRSVIAATKHYTISEYLKENPESRALGKGDYKVGGYDVLSIIVYEEADLSRETVRVSADGYISFPLIGRLKVDDLATPEIEKLISLKLAEGQYLLDAHVSVMVVEYRSKQFMVMGAVKNPGRYPLQAEERVMDSLSRAGGIDGDKAGKRAMIIRTENQQTPRERKIVINMELQDLLKGRDQNSNIIIFDEDVLYVPQAEHFYVIGQVQRPGSYLLTDEEITLVEAISMAGGFTSIASRNKTRILRVEDGVEKVIQIKVDAITEAGRKIQDITIKPNDVIVIPESFF